MRLSRADRSRVADWWFTVDHVLVGAILALVAAGLILSLAASPAVAIRKGLPTYYFVERHLFFSAVGVLVMLTVSLFSLRGVRRLALGLFAVSIAGLVAVYFIGTEIHGAQRHPSLPSPASSSSPPGCSPRASDAPTCRPCRSPFSSPSASPGS
jgi:cell division protein FtsW